MENSTILFKKADFLTKFLDYELAILDQEEDLFTVWNLYNEEAQDCVFTGNFKETDDYLNDMLERMHLTEKWNRQMEKREN